MAVRIYKYTNVQIYKYTNIQIYKYANIRIHEYTNTNIQIKTTNIYTDHPQAGDHSINGSSHIYKQPHDVLNRRLENITFSVLGQFGSYPFAIRRIVLYVSPSAKELPFSLLRTLCGKKPKLWCFNEVLSFFLQIRSKLPPWSSSQNSLLSGQFL